MGLFRRSKKQVDSDDPADEAAQMADIALSSSGKPLPTGPFDISQVPEQKDYVDFGVFLIPPVVGLSITPEFDSQNKSVVGLTLQLGSAVAQIMAVAATKSQTMWDQVRAEVRGDLTKQGATTEEVTSRFGKELHAQIPAKTADGTRGIVQMRFVGIDGPNWFMRIVFNRTKRSLEKDNERLDEVISKILVHRDGTPRPPREVLPVILPQQLYNAAQDVEQAETEPEES